MLSLDDLDATKASEEAFEFEYILPDGSGSGVFLQVLGGQSQRVIDETARLMNERRRKEAHIAAMSRGRRKNDAFTPVEDDIAFGQRLAAIRLAGWRGIKEKHTPELALKLCRSNQHLADQVSEVSEELGNFMKISSASSSSSDGTDSN
jgi:hypothetical protein